MNSMVGMESILRARELERPHLLNSQSNVAAPRWCFTNRTRCVTARSACTGPWRNELMRLFEPIFETRATEDRIPAGSETFVVHRDAEIERFVVGLNGPGVIRCAQKLSDKRVLANRLGPGQFDHSIE